MPNSRPAAELWGNLYASCFARNKHPKLWKVMANLPDEEKHQIDEEAERIIQSFIDKPINVYEQIANEHIRKLTETYGGFRQTMTDHEKQIWYDAHRALEIIKNARAEQNQKALCTYGPQANRKRRWILKFDDRDVADMHFDDEGDAMRAWDRAKDNWTCTLFVTAEFVPMKEG